MWSNGSGSRPCHLLYSLRWLRLRDLLHWSIASNSSAAAAVALAAAALAALAASPHACAAAISTAVASSHAWIVLRSSKFAARSVASASALATLAAASNAADADGAPCRSGLFLTPMVQLYSNRFLMNFTPIYALLQKDALERTTRLYDRETTTKLKWPATTMCEPPGSLGNCIRI
jgi:hypothetical protein